MAYTDNENSGNYQVFAANGPAVTQVDTSIAHVANQYNEYVFEKVSSTSARVWINGTLATPTAITTNLPVVGTAGYNAIGPNLGFYRVSGTASIDIYAARNIGYILPE